MATRKKTGEIGQNVGGTSLDQNLDESEAAMAVDGKVTITDTDTVAGDDLTLAILESLVPGLGSAQGVVTPNPPNYQLRRDNTTNPFSLIGNTVVAVPPATATAVVMSVQVLPFVDATGLRYNLLAGDPAVGDVGHVLVDVENGTVPGTDGITRRLYTPPLVVRTFKVGETIFEQTTGKYFVCSKAGATVPTDAALATYLADPTPAALATLYTGLAGFTVAVGSVAENLDDWDDVWGPDFDYTFDYETAAAGFGRAADGTFAAAIVYPVDPLDATDALYTEAVKALAAKSVFYTDATFVAGSLPPKKCETDAEWAAHFDLIHRDANDRYHPSVVSALRAAINQLADARPDAYYQLADDLADPAKTGQAGYVADEPGVGADLKQADDNTLIPPLAVTEPPPEPPAL